MNRDRRTKPDKQKPVEQNIETGLSKIRNSAKRSTSVKSRTNSQKNKNLCFEGCKRHDFELRAVGYSAYLFKQFNEITAANFCTKGNYTTLPIISKQLLTQPQVPLFILNQQIYRYKHYKDSHQLQFKDAITKAQKLAGSDEETELIIPVPKNKSCQICRVKIETEQEYENHISTLAHLANLRCSFGQKLIIQETQKFMVDNQLVMQKLTQLSAVAHILQDAKKMLKNLLILPTKR